MGKNPCAFFVQRRNRRTNEVRLVNLDFLDAWGILVKDVFRSNN
jgi:hypothetical protein